MGSFNLTNFDAAMKHMYPYKKVENMVYQNNPLFSIDASDPVIHKYGTSSDDGKVSLKEVSSE